MQLEMASLNILCICLFVQKTCCLFVTCVCVLFCLKHFMHERQYCCIKLHSFSCCFFNYKCVWHIFGFYVNHSTQIQMKTKQIQVMTWDEDFLPESLRPIYIRICINYRLRIILTYIRMDFKLIYERQLTTNSSVPINIFSVLSHQFGLICTNK